MSKSADKILNTAEYLFNRDSFSGVGVDLIRDESGCSKTTLYSYFKNKKQLMMNVLEARDLRFQKSLSQYVGNATDIEALNLIYCWHIEWFKQDYFKGCLFVRAAAESLNNDSEILNISQAHKHWIYQFISAKVQTLKQPKAVVELCYLFLEGLISHFLVEGFEQKKADQTMQLMNILILQLQQSEIA